MCTEHELWQSSEPAKKAELALRKKGYKFVSWIGTLSDFQQGYGEMHVKKRTSRSSNFNGISCDIAQDGSCSGFDTAEDFLEAMSS